MNVKTSIGKRFFAILKKHFPPGSPLSKVFNKKTVKMSYSCLPSMKTIVASHNKQLLRRPPEEHRGGCNCRSGVENCPLDGQCKLRSIVYNATIQSREGEREYVGQTTKTFKERFNSHKSDAKIPSREKVQS